MSLLKHDFGNLASLFSEELQVRDGVYCSTSEDEERSECMSYRVSPMRKIWIVSSNMKKLAEYALLFDGVANVESIVVDDIPEAQGSAREIIYEKAIHIANKTGRAIIVDDTCCYLAACGAASGPFVKFLGYDERGKSNDSLMCDRLYRMSRGFADKRIIFECYLAYCEPGAKPVITIGKLVGKCIDPNEGRSEASASGTGRDFGFDPVFGIVNTTCGSIRSLAQMTMDEKNEIGPRGIAAKKMIKILNSSSGNNEDFL